MISAPTFCPEDAEIMEWWFLLKNPIFHHSRFPQRLRFKNPLGMITFGHLKDRFWPRVMLGVLKKIVFDTSIFCQFNHKKA
jgi:hypothetical protein